MGSMTVKTSKKQKKKEFLNIHKYRMNLVLGQVEIIFSLWSAEKK